MNRLKDTYKHMAAVASALLLALSVLPACSDDEGGGADVPEGQYAKLVISLGSLDNATPAATKAEPIDEEDDSEYEYHIENWWLVVMHNNAVVNVLSNVWNDPFTHIGGDQNEHQVELELLIDEEYEFYAFANLPEANQTYFETLRNTVQRGGNAVFDIDQTVESIEASTYDSGTSEAGPYFPMSSYKYSVTVTEGATVSIPLIRLLGKVSLSIQNSSNEKITLRQVSLNKFRTTGSIYLLPYDAAKGGDTKLLEATGTMTETYGPSFPGETDETTITGDFTPKYLLGQDDAPIEIAKNEKHEFPDFYVNETRFTAVNNNAGDPLLISADIGRDDQLKETSFNFIRRNDWLIIPLLISDAETKITIQQQHMPIGGIPTYVFEKDWTVSNINVTLDHAGDINIGYSVTATGATGLKYYPGGDIVATERYSSAVLESQTNDWLINVPEANNDGGWQPNAIEFTLNHDDTSPLSGSFTITAQELAYTGTATINLTLIVLINDSEVVLPYTITLTNGKPAKQGGN